jgi:hypothetical protein
MRSYHWHVATRSAEFMSTFGPDVYNEIASSDDWHRPYLMANTEAFNLMFRSVVMPQPGDYRPAGNRGVVGYETQTIFDTDTSGTGGLVAPFTIALGDARYIDDNFNSDADGGGSWEYHYWMNYAGFDVEKALAIASLVDGRPPVYAPSRDLFLDPRTQNVSFHTDMPSGVERLLGGLFSEDWETIGMYGIPTSGTALFESTATPQLLPIADPAVSERPAGAKILFPNVGYNQQSIAAVLAALYSRGTGDMTILNKMRIWIEGVDGTVGSTGFPDPAQQIRLFNPATGFTYIARRFGPDQVAGKTVDRGVGSRMLEYANWLLAKTYKSEWADGKPVVDEYGQVVLILDDKGQAELANPEPSETSLAEFTRYMGLIDAMRQIGLVLGGGPL